MIITSSPAFHDNNEIIKFIEIEKNDKNKTFTIPDTLNGKPVILGSFAFLNSDDLEEFYDKEAISVDTIIVPKNVKLVTSCFSGVRARKIIIENASRIPSDCFSGSWIESIEFKGTGPSEIDEAAFYDCKRLKSFYWPTECCSIPENCFCLSGIESISGIENVTYIGPSAFASSKMQKFDWPKNCKRIPSDCFADSRLKKITGIESVESIGTAAFSGTAITQFEWPSGCTIIPERCFSDSDLSAITGIGFVTKTRRMAFSGSKIKKIEWPKFCSIIPPDCFFNSELDTIENIELVKEIHGGAFASTRMTNKFVLPIGVNELYPGVFNNTSVKKIIFTSNEAVIHPNRQINIDCRECELVIIVDPKNTDCNNIELGFDTIVEMLTS